MQNISLVCLIYVNDIVTVDVDLLHFQGQTDMDSDHVGSYMHITCGPVPFRHA